MIKISKQQCEDALAIINDFKEVPSTDRLILFPFKVEVVEQLESGILLPPKAMLERMGTKDNREARYRTIELHTAVVVGCADHYFDNSGKRIEGNKFGAKNGDVIRFSPVSANDFEHTEYQLLVVYGNDLFITDGNVNDRKFEPVVQKVDVTEPVGNA